MVITCKNQRRVNKKQGKETILSEDIENKKVMGFFIVLVIDNR